MPTNTGVDKIAILKAGLRPGLFFASFHRHSVVQGALSTLSTRDPLVAV
jgi:hypothetical protein